MSLRLKPLVLLCAISGCSVYMEATRPTPTDLVQFHPGDTRTSVREKLGSPVDTSKGAGGNSCDLYLLYLRGYGTAGKVPIAVVESAADFFTIGLAEIVLSPTEAVTRNEKRPVWFCYQNDALLSVIPKSAETATPTPETPTPETPTPSPASSESPSPTASLASTPGPSENPTPTSIETPMNTASPTPTATAPSGE